MNTVYKTFSTAKGLYVYDRSTNTMINVNKEEFDLLNHKDADTIMQFREKGYLKENTIEYIKHPTAIFSNITSVTTRNNSSFS